MNKIPFLNFYFLGRGCRIDIDDVDGCVDESMLTSHGFGFYFLSKPVIFGSRWVEGGWSNKRDESVCVRRGGEGRNSLTRFARSLGSAYAVLGASLLRRGRRYRKPPACY